MKILTSTGPSMDSWGTPVVQPWSHRQALWLYRGLCWPHPMLSSFQLSVFSLQTEITSVTHLPFLAERQQFCILLGTGWGWGEGCVFLCGMHAGREGIGFGRCCLTFAVLENLSLQVWLHRICGFVEPGALHWWQWVAMEWGMSCAAAPCRLMWHGGAVGFPPCWGGEGTRWTIRAQACQRSV